MRNHIILGSGRSILLKHLPTALHHHHLSHKNGSGTPAVKKNYGGRMVTSPSVNKQFKPLKFKM